MVQSNPQILQVFIFSITFLTFGHFLMSNDFYFPLQPVLQELGKQNPGLLRLIQEHHGEFLQLINEPVDGSEG